jgi:MFS transporter, YNFM family, putative membrane transport protein
MRTFHASHFVVSLTVTAPAVAVAISAPIVGRLADLVGRKRVIVGSAFLLAAASLLTATATDLRQLIFWRFLQGLATPGVFATTIAYIHEEWPGSHAARGTSAYVGGTVTGGFFGRALVGLVASAWNWHMAFVVLSGVNLLAAMAIAAWMPTERGSARASHGAHAKSLGRLLRNSQMNVTNAVGFCVLFVQVAVFSYVTFYLGEPPFSLSTAALGWLFTVFIFGAIVTPIVGQWIDRHGHRVGVTIAMGLGAAGALSTLAPSLPVIIAGLALIGTGVFIGQATASSYIGVITHEDRGLAVGVYSTFYYVGGSLGGALPAIFWNAGGWPACVLLVVLVQTTTAVLALRFWRRTGAHMSVIQAIE